MRKILEIAVVIPALNEEESIGQVLREIPLNIISKVLVVDNGSTDNTGVIAKENGAFVVKELKQGYGRACKAGIRALQIEHPSIVVFLDGDYSDYPYEIKHIIMPILMDDLWMI